MSKLQRRSAAEKLRFTRRDMNHISNIVMDSLNIDTSKSVVLDKARLPKEVNPMKMISRAIIVVLAMVLAGASLHAQGATAAISGTVLDPSGAAIAGASITVRNVGTAFTGTVLSDDQGRYVVPELPIGDYEVQASLPGFQPVARRRIAMTVGSRPVIDLQLPIGLG